MRLVYLGTPADAVPPLRALHAAGHEIPLVVSQPDRRRGRGSATAPSPVTAAARDLGLPVRTPGRATEVVEEIAALDADVGVVVAFGQLLPTEVLTSCRLGFVNLHFSLLPRWRGAAPVERAVLAGDTETGVCVMALDEGMDTGPVYDCVRTGIDPDESAGELRARLVELGSDLLVETLPRIADRAPAPQVGAPTHAAKLTVDEFRLDPRRPAVDLARLVRAGNPRPGAWGVVGDRRVKVLRAQAIADGERGSSPIGAIDRDGAMQTGAGLLVLHEVQPEGRPVMPGRAWRDGLRDVTVVLDAPS